MKDFKPMKNRVSENYDGMETLIDTLTERMQQFSKAQNAVQEALGQLTQYIAAPSIVERDENGRVTGARKDV